MLLVLLVLLVLVFPQDARPTVEKFYSQQRLSGRRWSPGSRAIDQDRAGRRVNGVSRLLDLQLPSEDGAARPPRATSAARWLGVA